MCRSTRKSCDVTGFYVTAADRINAPSKHLTLTVGDRELVAQNVILIFYIIGKKE